MIINRTGKNDYDKMAQSAIYIYLFNALFKYFLPSILTKILPILAICLMFLSTYNQFKIKINNIDKPFYIFLFIWTIGCIYSPEPAKGMGYVLSFALALLLSSYGCTKKINEKKIVIFVAMISLLISMFVIVQPIMPNVITQISYIFNYTSSEYVLMQAWARNGWYSGLFPDRAPAAFYACLLTATGLFFLYDNYGKKMKILKIFFGVVFLFVGLYTILLTAKRGLLLGSIAAALVTFVIYKKANKSSIWKICLGIIGSVFIIWLVFSQFEATKTMMLRFFMNDNIMSGRENIYQNICDYILLSPLLGNGTASAFSLLGIGGHNIYLTVFMENGLIGVTIFVIMLGYSLYKTIKIAMLVGQYNKKDLSFLMFSLFIQIFFLVYGMSGNPLYDNYILYFYVFAIFIVKNEDNRIYKVMQRRCIE